MPLRRHLEEIALWEEALDAESLTTRSTPLLTQQIQKCENNVVVVLREVMPLLSLATRGNSCKLLLPAKKLSGSLKLKCCPAFHVLVFAAYDGFQLE